MEVRKCVELKGGDGKQFTASEALHLENSGWGNPWQGLIKNTMREGIEKSCNERFGMNRSAGYMRVKWE